MVFKLIVTNHTASKKKKRRLSTHSASTAVKTNYANNKAQKGSPETLFQHVDSPCWASDKHLRLKNYTQSLHNSLIVHQDTTKSWSDYKLI